MPRVFNAIVDIRGINEFTPEVPVDITEKVRKLTIRESLFTGHIEWEMEIAANQINSEEEFMFLRILFQIRLTMTRERIPTSTGWKTVLVTGSEITYYGDVPYIRVFGTNAVEFLKNTHKWASYINLPATQVVNTIAIQNGLQALAALRGNGTWYQAGQTDWEILNQIREETISAQGSLNTWLYVDNNFIKYLILNYSELPKRVYNIGAGDDRVESVTFKYNGREVENKGGLALRTAGYNIDQKRLISSTPIDSQLPKLATKVPGDFSSITRYQITSLQREDLIQNRSLVDWIETSSRYFGLHMKVVGDLTLNLGDIVNINITDPEGSSSSMEGKYPIYELIHKYHTHTEKYRSFDTPVEEVGVTTHIVGYRRTYNFGDITSIATTTSNLRGIDPYVAGGRRNVLEENPTTIVSRELS